MSEFPHRGGFNEVCTTGRNLDGAWDDVCYCGFPLGCGSIQNLGFVRWVLRLSGHIRICRPYGSSRPGIVPQMGEATGAEDSEVGGRDAGP